MFGVGRVVDWIRHVVKSMFDSIRVVGWGSIITSEITICSQSMAWVDVEPTIVNEMRPGTHSRYRKLFASGTHRHIAGLRVTLFRDTMVAVLVLETALILVLVKSVICPGINKHCDRILILSYMMVLVQSGCLMKSPFNEVNVVVGVRLSLVVR
jgi:hypothetical protein